MNKIGGFADRSSSDVILGIVEHSAQKYGLHILRCGRGENRLIRGLSLLHVLPGFKLLLFLSLLFFGICPIKTR